MVDRVDVAVIGGGAAGIAAARQLTKLQRSVLLLEALPRLGGRAHTVNLRGMPLDLGCGWLHSAERNPLAALAASLGCELDRSESAWGRQLHDLNFPPHEQQQAWNAYRQFQQQLRAAAPATDRAGDALPATERWRPFIDGLSSFINGAGLDELSAADFIAYDDASSDNNWRLPAGYGAFITGLAKAVPLALATPVTAIACRHEVAIETPRGTIHAQAAIVTVSTAVLAAGRIRFIPSMDEHLHAAACVPLGLANKVFLSLAEPEAVPAESHLLGRTDSAATGSYYIRPFGRAVIECFLGGNPARDLERGGEGAAAAFAIDELRGLLGADFAAGLAPLAVTRWAQEPTVGGSYSHALPGHAAARRVLARPMNERLCLAGEACSMEDFSTAHGAWQSGLVAAEWADRSLGP